MNPMRFPLAVFLRALSAVALSVSLSGCGSGGGDSSPPAPAAQFGSPVLTSLAAAPIALVFADFDRDGKADAIASTDGKTLLYLHGNGDGTFQQTHLLGGVTSFLRIAATDLNRDGNPDLVVLGCVASPCLGAAPYVYLGNGAGAFSFPIAYDAGLQATSLAIGDFNGDGKPDVAVSHGSPFVTVLLGNGDGSLGPPASWSTRADLSPPQTFIGAGDFNGDGRQDLLVLGGGTIATTVLLTGRGNGEFDPPKSSGLGVDPAEIAIADVNRDGRSDFVVNGSRPGTQPGPGSPTILLGGADGTFSPITIVTDDPNFFAGVNIAVGDLDRDGLPDLVTLGSLGDLSLYYGKGDGTFQPRQAFASALTGRLRGIDLVDVNGDGRVDLVVRTDTGLTVLLNTR